MNWQDLHLVDPYLHFPVHEYPEHLRGWHEDDALFRRVIAEVRPALIVEVGTWLGESALAMANHCDALQLPETTIVCVDTWLGSVEMWDNKADADRYRELRLHHGYPTLYYQFVANVVRRHQQHRIVPFPQTSIGAAALFRYRAWRPSLIYIDGSHEELDVLADIAAWSPVLADGGVMFGDDYHETWPGVMRAVDALRAVRPEQWTILGRKWIWDTQGRAW